MNARAAIAEYLGSCRARNLAPRTITWYGFLLGKFNGEFTDLPADPAAVERFLGGVAGGDETRHGYYRALRAFYRWAVERHQVADPMNRIAAPRRRKKTRQYLSTEETGWLLATPMEPRDRALVILLLDTGIRIGEALNLVAADILGDVLLVDGKTGQREVPVSPEAREQLLQLADRGPIFRGMKGKMTASGAYRVVRNALARAGITTRKRGPHVLRHTFGRLYILAGGDLVSLQRILGHSNIKTTEIYAELDLRDITAQHHRFSPLKTALAGAQAGLWKEPTPRF